MENLKSRLSKLCEGCETVDIEYKNGQFVIGYGELHGEIKISATLSHENLAPILAAVPRDVVPLFQGEILVDLYFQACKRLDIAA